MSPRISLVYAHDVDADTTVVSVGADYALVRCGLAVALLPSTRSAVDDLRTIIAMADTIRVQAQAALDVLADTAEAVS